MRRKMPNGLKAEVEAAVTAEVERVGLAGFAREPVVARFRDRAGRSTLFRWIDACLASGRPGAAATAAFKAKVDEIAAASPEPEEAVMGEIMARVPQAVTLADAMADPGGVAAVVERIARIQRLLDKLEAHALTPDGAVRNAALLLRVAAVMDRSLATACRLREMLRDDEALERRTAAMCEEIRRESPDCARRIAVRLFELDRGLRGGGAAPRP
jgi:hypothetical protein